MCTSQWRPRGDAAPQQSSQSPARCAETHEQSIIAKATRAFARDERGSTVMVFGLMIVPLMMLLGMAVDLGRGISVRSQMQGALDAAALAGGRAAQTATSNHDTLAQNAASQFFNSATISHAVSKTLSTVQSNGSKTEFLWTATAWVPSPFIGIGQLMGSEAADADAPAACKPYKWQCMKVVITSQAMLQSGGNNNDTNIETALMLDITGSMSGSKLSDLKLAAKDLIDIIVWDDQSKVTSKVSVVPFSARVNVGSYASAVTGLAAISGSNKLKPCVTERTGTHQYTDEAPATGRFVGPFNANNSSAYGNNYSSSGSCDSNDPSSTEALVPLTSNRTTAKNRIDALTAGGATAGHLGTAWAWYTISPKWSSIWPSESKPGNYNDPKLKKIAVLMTDGDYNVQYSSTSSQSQAGQLCTNMKTAGVEIYTVGFMVSTSAKNFLTTCATDAAHYYDATSGDALRMAFRDIALKISSLRLKK